MRTASRLGAHRPDHARPPHAVLRRDADEVAAARPLGAALGRIGAELVAAGVAQGPGLRVLPRCLAVLDQRQLEPARARAGKLLPDRGETVHHAQRALLRRARLRPIGTGLAPEGEQVLDRRDLGVGRDVLAEGQGIGRSSRCELAVNALQGVVSGAGAEAAHVGREPRRPFLGAHRRTVPCGIEAENVVEHAGRTQREVLAELRDHAVGDFDLIRGHQLGRARAQHQQPQQLLRGAAGEIRVDAHRRPRAAVLLGPSVNRVRQLPHASRDGVVAHQVGFRQHAHRVEDPCRGRLAQGDLRLRQRLQVIDQRDPARLAPALPGGRAGEKLRQQLRGVRLAGVLHPRKHLRTRLLVLLGSRSLCEAVEPTPEVVQRNERLGVAQLVEQLACRGGVAQRVARAAVAVLGPVQHRSAPGPIVRAAGRIRCARRRGRSAAGPRRRAVPRRP